MAFKLRGTGVNTTKVYLQPTADGAAPGSRHWEYVSADTPAAVENCGYIDNSTEDGQIAIDMLQVGDLVWVYQVAAIVDSRPISADKAGGVVDLSLHCVLVKTATFINLSDDLLGATVTYTS